MLNFIDINNIKVNQNQNIKYLHKLDLEEHI